MSTHTQAQEASQWEDTVLQTHTGHLIGYLPQLQKWASSVCFLVGFFVLLGGSDAQFGPKHQELTRQTYLYENPTLTQKQWTTATDKGKRRTDTYTKLQYRSPHRLMSGTREGRVSSAPDLFLHMTCDLNTHRIIVWVSMVKQAADKQTVTAKPPLLFLAKHLIKETHNDINSPNSV